MSSRTKDSVKEKKNLQKDISEKFTTPDAKNIEETLKLAASMGWTRCYSCNHFVEKKSGCLAIICRCRAEFCYRCGGKMLDHYNCSRHCQNYTLQQLAALRKPIFVNKDQTSTSAAGTDVSINKKKACDSTIM